MKILPSIATALLAGSLPSLAADLAGKVLRYDSLAQKGVIVALTGSTLSDTTDDKGEWTLVTPASGLIARPMAIATTSHLVVRNGRLQLSLSGRDALGRNPTVSSANSGSFFPTAARSAAAGYDTLVYSWNGKIILRDTISREALTTKGIVRHFDTTVNPSITHGYLSDAQGHFYRTVAIGKQVWMAENLNIKVDGSWCYQDSAALCPEFGRLYLWSALFGLDTSFNHKMRGKGDTLLQGICPAGWRIPRDSDYVLLLKDIDAARSGVLLRSREGWNAPATNGNDSLGFKAVGGGYRNSDGKFGNLRSHTAYWASTESSKIGQFIDAPGSFAWTGHIDGSESTLTRLENFKDLGMSLRCIQGVGETNK